MSTQKLSVRLDASRGYSAYEIAVKNGYSGTEEQWIAAIQGLPEMYLKSAAVSNDILTLTKQDDTTVSYAAQLPVGSVVLGNSDSMTFSYGTWILDGSGTLSSYGTVYVYRRTA